MTMKRTKFNIRTIAVTGMLGALATVLMFLEFPIPMLIPPFIKFDFSELPALHRQVESENYLTLS